MARDGGYLLPDDPMTEEATCIRITLPNDPNYRRAFWGALWTLTYKSNWQQGNDAVLDIVTTRMETMWWDAVEAWNPLAEGECEVFDIRVLGGMLQKTYNGGIDWLDVSPISVGNPIQSVVTNTLAAGEEATATLVNGVLTLGIPQGAQGAQGIQGLQGVAGENGTAGAAGADATMPVGTIVAYPTAGVPDGWLRCNGSAFRIDLNQYPELYALIGTTYGATTVEGQAAYRVPDLRDRYVRGVAADISKVAGDTGGANTVTLTLDNIPPHVHDMQHTHNLNARDGSALGTANSIANSSAAGSSSDWNTGASSTEDTGETGGSGGVATAHNNEPAYLVLNWIICAVPNSTLNVEFQVDGCDLQWRKDSGAWSTLVDLSECTVQGEQGEQGIQGVQGERGVSGDCECSDSPTPITNDWETWCGIANGITAYMNVYLEDVLDRIDATNSVAQAAGSLFSVVPVIGWETDGVVETITDAVNVTTNGVRADITEATIQEARDALYDIIAANDGYSMDVLNQWRDEQALYWGLQLNAGMVVYMSVINDLSEADWARQAYLGSLEPSTECSEDIPCTMVEERVWYPPEQGLTSPDAEGELSPTPPPVSDCDGEYFYEYETGDTVTFTLDTPLPAEQVQIAVYLSEPVSFAPSPIVYVNGEQVTTNFRQGGLNVCPVGMDSLNTHFDFAPTLVETVQITFPAGRALWFLRHITFQKCVS